MANKRTSDLKSLTFKKFTDFKHLRSESEVIRLEVVFILLPVSATYSGVSSVKQQRLL